MGKFAQYIYNHYMQNDAVIWKSEILKFICYNICPSKTCPGKDRSRKFKENIRIMKNYGITQTDSKFTEFLKSKLIGNKELEYFKNDLTTEKLNKIIKNKNTTDITLFDLYFILNPAL